MTDAITVLTSDHRSVDALFRKVEGRSDPDPAVVHEIVKELSVHDAIEKQLLYPEVRDVVDGGDALADHSIEEHNEVAETLVAIDKADDGSQEQAQHLSTLIELVRRHVDEEEQQIFPGMRSTMDAQQLEQLGERLEAAKKAAPTRPHPHAPDEGLGTTVAGAMSKPLDKVRDVVEGR